MSKQVASFLRKLVDLHEGADHKEAIIEKIKDDGDFSIARFWMLVFAIGVASVGLNINSIPVIVGAMLISPLMGPIVSMGLALSINDWGLMRRSFRNMLILTFISIGISALYFSITPITNAQSELLSRIQPTIFDVLIAIFGGIAGFIGISRARYNNVIPGVAIATALMPPLCTVGYGIATLQTQFIFGAFYLFLINSIFICLSSLMVASYLKLPKREYPTEDHKKRVNRIITAIIAVITLPAMYTAFMFVEQNNFKVQAEEYITNVFEDRGYVVIHKDITNTQTERSIELAFLSESFSDEQVAEFKDRLDDFGLVGTNLIIVQNGFTLTESEWQSVLADVRGDDEKLQVLEARLESERLNFENPTRLLQEAKAINERIENLAVGSLEYGASESELSGMQKVVLVYSATSSGPLAQEEKDVVSRWLDSRFSDVRVVSIFYPEVVPDGDSVGTSTEKNTLEE
jgi:uncharacterized hydrophobic protein (TIGR00271 family)